jgi:hypothetical protein
MAWNVEYTDEFGAWWAELSETEQEDVGAVVDMLEEKAALPFPYSSSVETSRHSHMRELRIQHRGRPYRVLYAFDPLRSAILLIGGDKTGKDRWYDDHVPVADRLYDQHLRQLHGEDG